MDSDTVRVLVFAFFNIIMFPMGLLLVVRILKRLI